MKLKDVLAGIPISKWNADPETEITGLSCDSRTVESGQLYVAVVGYAADGHRFIGSAANNGASVVLCQTPPQEAIPYVLTADTRTALADAAANWYGHPGDKMTVIGVTGTNGKTTVTYLLKTILEQTIHAKVGLIGTIQNMIGGEIIPTERTTPESIEVQKLFRTMLDAGCTHVVMEVSSHALYLSRVRGISYTVGVFTNLTQDHLDFHKTMENYCEAKKILFRNCKYGVFNGDDSWCSTMMAGVDCKKYVCSVGGQGNLVASHVEQHSDRVTFTVSEGESSADICLHIPGRFSVYNALSVIGALRMLGISLRDIADGLKLAHGVPGRVEVVPTPGKDYTVLIDYAHTPDGLENVLSSVREYCKGRLIAVFGCGGDRDPIKRPIMGKIGAELADFVVYTSDNPRTEDPDEIIRQVVAGAEGTSTPYVIIENRREAIAWAMDHGQKEDIIVLAGKGHEDYQIIGTKKYHLDEREVVADHLAGK